MKIGWWVLLIMLFGLTLAMGVWYGDANTPLKLQTEVVRVETENIMLQDKVAALEVDAVIKEQKIEAMLERMTFFDICRQKQWRNC